MVTGASTGLGLGIAIDLATRGAAVHIVCRSRQRGEEAVKRIKQVTNNEKVFLHLCDLGEMKQVKLMVELFLQEFKELHILVNNAGCMVNKREVTQ
jgi:dehydrogenase/reductase SDR family protein 12